MFEAVQLLAPENSRVLMKIFAAESGFNHKAKNPKSSAKGIGQIVDDTAKGLKDKYGVDSESVEDQIKGANLLLKELKPALKSVLNRNPSDGELYVGYFLGEPNAKKFFKALTSRKGNQDATKVLPANVVSSNPSVFYVDGDKSKPRTLSQVYRTIRSKAA